MIIPWLGYSELIDTFTFREKASISIPKKIRERAFSLQVDIEVVSTDGNDYTNNKSIPEYGFYGYAVLVFRDHSEIQVPLAQPRQRLYYGRVDEAFVNWYQFYLQRNTREWTRGLADVIGQIGQAVGLGEYVVPPKPCIEWSGFEELPLRELYVKCRFGTQFKIEVARWEAEYEQSTDGCPSVPESKQADDSNGDGTGKDDGLPPLGVLPQKASDPNNPYAELPSPSTNQQLGEYGNNKINSVNLPNPDNVPSEEASADREGWYIKIFTEYLQNAQGQGLRGYVYFPCKRDSVLGVTFHDPAILNGLSPCGGFQYQYITVSVTKTSTSFQPAVRYGQTQTAEILFGLLPEWNRESVNIICT